MMKRSDPIMRRRTGFTLVELMVSLALIVFIMAILAEAFGMATKTFTDLKGAGDLAEKLRTTTAILRKYLAANHFVNSATGMPVRLGYYVSSTNNFWTSNHLATASPPDQGFFRIYQGGQLDYGGGAPPRATAAPSNNYFEGQDTTLNGPAPWLWTTGFPTYRVVDHALQFSVYLPLPGSTGSNRSDWFSASIPGSLSGTPWAFDDSRYQDTSGLYTSRWAEMAFFLRPLIDNVTGLQETANGTKLWGLYMRQALPIPVGTSVPPASGITTPSDYIELSGLMNPIPPAAPPYTFTFNSAADFTEPARRFGMDRTAGNTNVLAGTLPAPTAPTIVNYHTFVDDLSGASSMTYRKYAGADLLLTNVVSFEVRVLVRGGQDFVDLFDSSIQSAWNKDNGGVGNANNSAFYSSTTNPTLPAVFDTWSATNDTTLSYNYSTWNTAGTTASIPLYDYTGTNPIIIQAVQVTLRVWDDKTELTRQVTIIVPMT